MNHAVKWWLGLLLAAVALYGGYSLWRIYGRLQESNQATSEPEAPRKDAVGTIVQPFTLTERSGQPFDSRELAGKVWVASFFFSSCPGACLRMNNVIAQLQREMPDSEVRFVSITVDPENDTPEVLDKYARHYSADPERWLFLTGPAAELQKLANDTFLVGFGRETHSDRLIVVDRQGRIQGTYRATDDAQVILLKRKLKELTQAPYESPSTQQP